MANAETVDAVEVEVRIAASPETVFDFFTEPELMVQWMGRRVELDPRPGGGFRCRDQRRRDRHRRVRRGRTAATGRLHLGLERRGLGDQAGHEHGRGAARARRRGNPPAADPHATCRAPSRPTKHGHGWRHYLERLAVVAAGGDPGRTLRGRGRSASEPTTRGTTMGNPTMWFEVAAKDREAMKGFYSGLFDWKLNDMEAMPYTGIETGERGDPGRDRRGAGGQRRATSPSTSKSTTSRPGSARPSRSAAAA